MYNTLNYEFAFLVDQHILRSDIYIYIYNVYFVTANLVVNYEHPDKTF